MLVLHRKQGERVVIGRDIVITMLESRNGGVRLGFETPQGVPIFREEVFDRIARAKPLPAESYQEGSPFFAEFS